MVIFWRTRLGPKFGRLWQKNLSHGRSLAAPVIADVKATAEQCQEQCTDPGRREQGRLFFLEGCWVVSKYGTPIYIKLYIGLSMQTHIINYTQIFGEHLVCQISRQTNGIMLLEWSTVQQPELPSASPFFFGPGGPKAGAVCKQEYMWCLYVMMMWCRCNAYDMLLFNVFAILKRICSKLISLSKE